MIFNFILADFLIKIKSSKKIIYLISITLYIFLITVLFLFLQKIYTSILINITYLLVCTIIGSIKFHYLNKYLKSNINN